MNELRNMIQRCRVQLRFGLCHNIRAQDFTTMGPGHPHFILLISVFLLLWRPLSLQLDLATSLVMLLVLPFIKFRYLTRRTELGISRYHLQQSGLQQAAGPCLVAQHAAFTVEPVRVAVQDSLILRIPFDDWLKIHRPNYSNLPERGRLSCITSIGCKHSQLMGELCKVNLSFKVVLANQV